MARKSENSVCYMFVCLCVWVCVCGCVRVGGGGNMVAPKRPGSFLERSLAADKFRPRDTSNDWRERLEHCSTTIEGLVIVLQRKWRDSWLHSNALDAMKDPERKPLGQSCALHFVSNKIEKKTNTQTVSFFRPRSGNSRRPTDWFTRQPIIFRPPPLGVAFSRLPLAPRRFGNGFSSRWHHRSA